MTVPAPGQDNPQERNIETAAEVISRVLERDGRYPPMPTDDNPDKEMALGALSALRGIAASLAAALEAATRERDEWKALFASLEPSPDGGYGPDGAPAWKEAYIARMLEGIEAQSRADAAERDLEVGRERNPNRVICSYCQSNLPCESCARYSVQRDELEQALADTTETFRLIAQAAGEDGTDPDEQ